MTTMPATSTMDIDRPASVHTPRPWCRWEVLTAKRLGRPVVAADLTVGRIERTYPYLGNVPSLRVTMPSEPDAPIPETAVEQLTAALLAEALRDELWRELAGTGLQGRLVHLLPRPPELADVSELVARYTGKPTEGKLAHPITLLRIAYGLKE